MPNWMDLDSFLLEVRIDPAVWELRPDYRALLVVADGIISGQGDHHVEELLHDAEDRARDALADRPVEELAHVATWRDAYRSFGAKPQRTRNSLEALLRRADTGLPRINQLTDIYNAISVIHQIPLGGEDLNRYVGPPRLIRANGTERFDTIEQGVEIVEHPEPGEVVWCDEVGVTCRRWNWRQTWRTRLQEDTTTALFILDALEPKTDEALLAAATDLIGHLNRLGSDVRTASRLISNQKGA
nr:phenylalanine--tRNA ligase beta subunit-related protein [Ferrimicrobium acidiphilum]